MNGLQLGTCKAGKLLQGQQGGEIPINGRIGVVLSPSFNFPQLIP